MIQFSNERVTIFQSDLYQTTSTVIETDDFILIVDPAWLPGEIQQIRNHVTSLPQHKQRFLLFTHGDFDHIIGCKAFPEARTIASIELRDHPEKEARVKSIHDFDTSRYITRDYPVEYPQIDIVIERDTQQIQIGSSQLTFYKAPGHTNDGLFTIVESLGIFLCGDYLSDFELPFIYHSAREYERTMIKAKKMLESHPTKLLIPGHGKHTEQTSEMERRIAVSINYIERLKQAVIAGDEEAMNTLRQEHGFLSSFTDGCHRENVNIIQSEYVEKGEK
ncbi:hydrolase glyoxylase [Cohnella kolymensis]|uniref:Hydrolase glyoxylase n=1 Tax=Cohnella kolymensis TaxID=1590652 RepID=A0ABR4ZZY4_9BACL|nr:MBL fold metallo-hydrolase [Cohnella kolymensis]KIL34378.1 hydrolase glyoxylase [Cohnella kolymensis]